ncbi:amino acid permease [Candidatus Bipolaricaulota bacterium]|nr:amino acid permease [Candidatus Bipolaricaulota bacterium]
MSNSSSGGEGSLSFLSVTAMGIGGMVGGGIFAVLGLAVKLGRGGTPIAFAIAGMIALITSYSYARLSVTFPSEGGTVEFLVKGFGEGIFTGGLNVLLWISYVIMLALYSYAFGGYAASFFSESAQPVLRHVFISAVMIFFTVLNSLGSKLVGEAEEYIVGVKLTILIGFVGVGALNLDFARLAPGNWTSVPSLLAGGMIIFLGYEGFELMANAAQDVKDADRNLPRAFFTAVGFTVLLYIAISFTTVANLPVSEIVSAKDYALAAAAKPVMGQLGFIIIAIAALLSTSSAINATLYSTSRVSYIIAKDGELPKMLEDKIWDQPLEGLFLTAGLGLLVANTLDISSISVMGSAGFLLIFVFVNVANFKLYDKTNSVRWLPAIGAVVCSLAFAALVWHGASELWDIFVLIGMIGGSFLIEAVYRGITGRGIKSSS